MITPTRTAGSLSVDTRHGAADGFKRGKRVYRPRDGVVDCHSCGGEDGGCAGGAAC